MDAPGSEKEVERLVTETERMLIRFAMRYLNDHASACDAVQDAYIRYIRFLQGPPPGTVENPGAWLFRTTRNLCLDVLKSARVRRSAALEESADPQTVSGPDVISERREDAALLRSLFALLEERERSIVILKMDHGKSYREIAEILSLTESNVGFLLHGALKKLRTAYHERKML